MPDADPIWTTRTTEKHIHIIPTQNMAMMLNLRVRLNLRAHKTLTGNAMTGTFVRNASNDTCFYKEEEHLLMKSVTMSTAKA